MAVMQEGGRDMHGVRFGWTGIVFAAAMTVCTGASAQLNEIERHRQAVAEITELGGIVDVEGAGSNLQTSILIGEREWEGGGEKLVELLHDVINVRTLDVRRYSIDDTELAQLRDILPDLEEFLLWPCRVTDDGMVYLRPSSVMSRLLCRILMVYNSSC